MTWSAILIGFLICHAVGDVLVQTEWQALNKPGGLGPDPVARRALLTHGATYTLAFVPALIWIGSARGAGVAVGLAALIALPHIVLDDRRLVAAWIDRVKHAPDAPSGLAVAVDQCFHLLCLWATALLAAG